MPIRYKNEDNRLLKGRTPLRRVMKGSTIVYGEIDSYNLIYTETLGCASVKIQRKGAPGFAGDTSIITCTGESKTYPIYIQDRLSVSSFEPSEGYLEPEISFSPSNVVTQDITLNIGINPQSYTLTFPDDAVGCTYVTVHREGVVTSGDLTLNAEQPTATIYRDDILSVVDSGTPEGYNKPSISLGGTGAVTGDRTIAVTPNPKAYKLAIPSIPTGTQVRYRRDTGSWQSLIDASSPASVTVYYNSVYTIQVCALEGYKIPTPVFKRNGSSASINQSGSYSAVSTYGDVSVSAVRTIVYTTTIEADNYTLTIPTPEAVASYNITPTYGAELRSATVTYIPSPYSIDGTTGSDEEITDATTISVTTSAQSLMAGSIIRQVTGSRVEGYSLDSIAFEGKTLPFSLQSDISIVAETTQGTLCTITYPAIPTGITTVKVKRTSTTYSLSTGSTVTLSADGGQITSFGSSYNCYIGDIITITATRADLYDKPTLGITGNTSQTLSKTEVEMESANVTLIIQAGAKAQTATFVSEATDGVGYWNFKIVSNYPNSAIGITNQSGGNAKLAPGTYTICEGDVISNEATDAKYARISLSEYRSPSLTLSDGTSALYTNERGDVEVNVEGNKTYTCSYIASTVLANASGSVDGASLTNYTFSTVVDGVAERRRISRVVLNYTAKRYLGDLITGSYRHLTYTLTKGSSFSIDWKGTGIGSLQSKSGVIKGTANWWADDIGYDIDITSRNTSYITSIDGVDITYTY